MYEEAERNSKSFKSQTTPGSHLESISMEIIMEEGE
jgi:hypothetical protein